MWTTIIIISVILGLAFTAVFDGIKSGLDDDEYWKDH